MVIEVGRLSLATLGLLGLMNDCIVVFKYDLESVEPPCLRELLLTLSS